MLDRRTLFGGAAATAALASTLKSSLAEAASEATAKDGKEIAAMIDPSGRGMDGRLPRLASLDLESQQDFTLGFRLMQGKAIRKAANERFIAILQENGVDQAQPISREELLKLIKDEPLINVAPRTWLSNQQITWKTLQDHFHKNADVYLSEMEKHDKMGGKLELHPEMNIPAYARHEIHIQPGGYVGDPFAGHIYHYGTNSFYIAVLGHNEQDQIHKSVAANMPVPKDGKVKRILDYGCGIGQMGVAMKERFPDAEVWASDVGGPMVRYGHMRANKLNVKVNFRQALAEMSGFPDGYFDIVTSYIVHHELPADITRKVIAEVQRITRPGGVYYPLDFNSGGVKAPPLGMYARWWDHRWNHEVWSFEYHSLDFSKEIGERGFTQVKEGKGVMPGFGHRHFIRT